MEINKHSFGRRTSLSPVEIYQRHLDLNEWSIMAEYQFGEFVYLGASDCEFYHLLRTLLRKTSAIEAIKVMGDISHYLKMPDLSELCSEEKFSGLLGVGHVANIGLSRIYLLSQINKERAFKGLGINIDDNCRQNLDFMLSEHNKIQKALDNISKDDRCKYYCQKSISKIADYYREKRYIVGQILDEGSMLKAFLELKRNPLVWALEKSNLDLRNLDCDVYPTLREKNNDTMFRFLCVVLLSLSFK